MTAPPKQRASRRNALLEQLMQLYPVFREVKPLAIGIHKAIVEDAARFDLTGAVAGMVTAEQQEKAVTTLKNRIRQANERRRADDEVKKRPVKLQLLAEKFNTR